MKNRFTLYVVIYAVGLLAAVLSGKAQTTVQTKSKMHVDIPVVAANPEDVGSIESIVRADYESISGGVGVPRQWGRDLSLYDPHAWFVGVSADPKSGAIMTRSFSEQEYIDITDADNVKDGVIERELAHRIHRFGNAATVLSSYEVKLSSTGKVASRGVNFYQVYFDGKRWWILSMVWDEERPGNPIPPELLPKN